VVLRCAGTLRDAAIVEIQIVEAVVVPSFTTEAADVHGLDVVVPHR
jgi:hypothetical protein